MQTFTNYEQILESVKQTKTATVAIAGADASAIEAFHASRSFARALLVGEKAAIEKAAADIGVDLTADGFKIEEAGPDEASVAARAVELVRTGQAEMLMKGSVKTATLMHAVLDRQTGLRPAHGETLLSHVSCIKTATYPKLLFATDAGIVIYPTLEQKKAILRNALVAAAALGVKNPKVAPLCAVETVNEKMPETLDADALRRAGEAGEFGAAVVSGPMAMDVAVKKECAKKKKIDSPVAGDADILLYPNIAAGNIAVKSLLHLADAQVGGVILGATAPIILLSRADDADERLYSVAFSKLVAEHLARSA